MGKTRIVGTVEQDAFLAMHIWNDKTLLEVRWYPKSETMEVREAQKDGFVPRRAFG